ncbi:MAG TPA: hypothetical protein VH396_02670 [Chitinophagaceae bacterium]|jgi:hypothetical protein
MANPNWIKGGGSPNPGGRKLKQQTPSIKSKVERFLKKQMSPQKLQVMYDALTAKDKLQMLLELLPYVAAKQTPQSLDALSNGEIEALYAKVIQGIETTSIHLIGDGKQND